MSTPSGSGLAGVNKAVNTAAFRAGRARRGKWDAPCTFPLAAPLVRCQKAAAVGSSGCGTVQLFTGRPRLPRPVLRAERVGGTGTGQRGDRKAARLFG